MRTNTRIYANQKDTLVSCVVASSLIAPPQLRNAVALLTECFLKKRIGMLEREIDKLRCLRWCKQKNQRNKYHDVDNPILYFLAREVAHVVEEDNLLDKFNNLPVKRPYARDA